MSQFEQITRRILVMHAEHSTDRPILAAIVGDKRTLLVDAGNSASHAAQFRQELERRGIRQPELLVLTHWHWDHTFGMSGWGIPAIAQAGTARVLESLTDRQWTDDDVRRLIPKGLASESTVADMRAEYGERRDIEVWVPDLVFEKGLTLQLGGVSCEVMHVGGDHSEDSCFIHVQEEGVLFVGDALAQSVYGGPGRYTSAHFLRLMGLVRQLAPEIVVESHGVPLTAEEFWKDIAPWEELARLAADIGQDRERLAERLRAYTGQERLSPDLEQAVDFYMAGLAHSE